MDFKVIVLAAGKGTRFKSELPKVLHRILGKPMLWYVLRSTLESGASEIVVVTGHRRELVEDFIRSEFPNVKMAVQEKQLGTGHAVLSTYEYLKDYGGKLVVLNGDMPLIKSEDIRRMAETNGDMAVLTAVTENPKGYGRILEENGEVVRIVEEKDASEEERKIGKVNTGVYSFDSKKLFEALREVRNENSQREYYLTDVLEIFKKKGYKVVEVLTDNFSSVMGVNNRYELSVAEKEIQRRIVKELQMSGVTVHNPETAYIEPDVEVGRDTEIFAPVFIRGRTKIGKNCYIGAFSDIGDSEIGDDVTVESHCWMRGALLKKGASVGPFAKLRPGTVLDEKAKIGTFVETKKAYLERGAKANHLTYLGDCRVGENTNIGAGTITCNYDGFKKWFTDIGKNVFVGSNTIFIAPVKVGDWSITAAGSVINRDVPENTLAVARAKQINYPGKAERIREKLKKRAEDEHSSKDS